MQASTTGGNPATCKSFEALLGMEIEEKMNVVVEWAKLRSAAEAEADTDTKKPRYEVGTEIIKSFGGDGECLEEKEQPKIHNSGPPEELASLRLVLVLLLFIFFLVPKPQILLNSFHNFLLLFCSHFFHAVAAYRGKIVAYDPVENYYHVRYEDSDSEDMEEKEIGLYLSQANTPTAQIPIAQGKGKKQIFKRWAGEHNDFCVTCDDSGDLLCCEFCANVQHATCLDPSLTESDLAFDFVCQQCMLDICLLHDND